MTPLVVMVAPNGARRTKADHANLAITPTEIADEAARCARAGASVLHVPVRAAPFQAAAAGGITRSSTIWLR